MIKSTETRQRTARIKQHLSEGKTVKEICKLENVTPAYIYNRFTFTRRPLKKGQPKIQNRALFSAPNPVQFTQELASVGFDIHYNMLRHKASGRRFDLKLAFSEHPQHVERFWKDPVWWLMNLGQYLKEKKMRVRK